MNVTKMREVADSLLNSGKYEDAYYVYDEILNQIWYVMGSVQNGLTDFSQSFLGNSYRSNYEFRNSYSLKATESIFKKWFDLDVNQTLNELTFSTYGHLQCISYSPNLILQVQHDSIFNEFMVLHTLILDPENENRVNMLYKITTPYVEGRQLKKLRSNLTEENLKKTIIENSVKIKSTDWQNVNSTLLDYLFNKGDNSSEFYTSVYKIVGSHFNSKTHRQKSGKSKEKHEYKDRSRYESYEEYEKYERYERFEKHSFKSEEEFDPTKATEFEKAKFYGNLLCLSGKVTKTQIRKNYLELISKYHPDKVFDLGDELKILAEKKTKQLNMAYEWMKKKYSI